jgi:monofunctional biosynthetic peptidoglycan transglycosylase
VTRQGLVTGLRQFLQFLMGVAAVGFAGLAYAWLTVPDVRALRTQTPEATAFMRMRADEAIAAGRKPSAVRRLVRYNQISPTLVRAVLVAEDAAFFSHDGIDYDELRAAIEMSFDRGVVIRGASTITQQLAKNLYLSPARDPYRKLRELFIARRLEAELSKVRILELYLNVIEWGDGVWGAEAAAQRYFGVSAADLSAEQSALMAGAIINPRVLSPARPNARLKRRQQIILGRMALKTPPEDRAPVPSSRQ